MNSTVHGDKCVKRFTTTIVKRRDSSIGTAPVAAGVRAAGEAHRFATAATDLDTHQTVLHGARTPTISAAAESPASGRTSTTVAAAPQVRSTVEIS